MLSLCNKKTASLGQGSEVGIGEGSWAQISSLEKGKLLLSDFMDKLPLSDFMYNSHMKMLISLE